MKAEDLMDKMNDFVSQFKEDLEVSNKEQAKWAFFFFLEGNYDAIEVVLSEESRS